MDFKYFRGYTNVIRMYSRSVQINGGERRLRARWTPELAQDIHSFRNIDAEAELTALLSRHISDEIDNSIILPTIRRIHSTMNIETQTVAVQPLPPPIGLLYYMDLIMRVSPPFKYGCVNIDYFY